MEASSLEESDLKGMEVCNFSGTEVALPLELIEQEEIFFRVVSMGTWRNILSPASRKHLEKFLPVLPTDYPHAQEENISALLSGGNFRFGNPVQQFQKKLQDGFFYPDVVKYKKMCRKAKYKEYKIQQQRYHKKVLREILISRQEILDQIGRQSPGEPIKTSGQTPSTDALIMEHRVSTRLKRILSECRQQCQVGNVSSDDEEGCVVAGSFGTAMGLFMTPFNMLPGMLSGFHPMLGAALPFAAGYHGFPYPSPAVHRMPSPNVVTEDDFQKMIQMHRKRRLSNEDHPELDTRFTSLQDIIYRTSPSKKSSKSSEVSKKKDKKAKVKKKLKQKLQQKQERQAQVVKYKDDNVNSEESALESHSVQVPDGLDKLPCFFSLLREIFRKCPDLKANLQKIKELVKTWQLSPLFAASVWGTQEGDWVKLVDSALMFLSGSSGDAPASFVPLVDFKERPQQWKWIGSNRDSDEQLELLCENWLQIKGQLTSKKGVAAEADSSSTPVPRVKTDFVVRPSTDDERATFRDQENKRYANPHKAFTFRMHGFESVVGPVKGVFSKDTNLNKAREHSLLISLRPPYVTILTLVRDAASRLPNGEGTRAEVCELLKDSQFLNPNSSDAQIHTVVSGALDRLHYERDPCVKYDSNRKVWIYLHRNRSEEEFEKIHQASAAAARAKKMQKPKVTRQPKSKETPAPPSLSMSMQSQDQKQEESAVDPPSVSIPSTCAQQSISFSQAESATDQSQVKGPSRLNTADLSLADSPSRKFTSALNTHTSVLNTADECVDASPLQIALGSDELQGGVGDPRKGSWSSDDESSDGTSATDHESDSGSAGSSSEGVRELHQGKGKTLPGVEHRFSAAEGLQDNQPIGDKAVYDADDTQGGRPENAESSSEQGSASDSDFSNVD